MASFLAELIYCHLQSDHLSWTRADGKTRERSERTMKKLLWILFLILFSGSISLAQNASATSAAPAPAKPTILKYDWSKEIILPAGWDWTPFGASSSDASDSGSGDSDLSGGFVPPVERLPFYYLYTLKIRNTDARAIAGVAWEYTFIDPGSNEKLAAHR